MMLRDCLNIGKSLNAPIQLLYPYDKYNKVIKIIFQQIFLLGTKEYYKVYIQERVHWKEN